MLNVIPQIIILIFSIIIHEIAHGRVALWRGDTTARDAGRLTLNPLPHIDIFGTILFPIFLILMRSPYLLGWAKPVPVNPLRFREMKKDMALVGLSGPVSNFLLAIGFTIFFRIARGTLGLEHTMTQALFYGVSINLVLGFFNLIPIPPLDGSRVVMGILPDDLALKYSRIERFGFLIIFGLLYLGILRMVLFPIVGFFLFLLVGPLS
jgi:Zn-dependent protease